MKTKNTLTPAIHRNNIDAVTNTICVPSSWTTPQTYHVIVEDGELSSAKYEGEFTKEQVFERYGLEPEVSNVNLAKIILENPNDQDLGKKIRSIFINSVL